MVLHGIYCRNDILLNISEKYILFSENINQGGSMEQVTIADAEVSFRRTVDSLTAQYQQVLKNVVAQQEKIDSLTAELKETPAKKTK